MTPPWLAALVSRSAPLIASPAPRADRARAVEHLRSCGASWGDLADVCPPSWADEYTDADDDTGWNHSDESGRRGYYP